MKTAGKKRAEPEAPGDVSVLGLYDKEAAPRPDQVVQGPLQLFVDLERTSTLIFASVNSATSPRIGAIKNSRRAHLVSLQGILSPWRHLPGARHLPARRSAYAETGMRSDVRGTEAQDDIFFRDSGLGKLESDAG